MTTARQSCTVKAVMTEEEPPMKVLESAAAEVNFTQALVESARVRKSWRERLQWIRDCFMDPAFTPGPGQLATIAIYLRLLATGELKCEEDGRHFRPNHHAEAALQIESALERLSTPETAWILRRIYPFLPSWGEDFRRSEPLTRIRDIAHRNDIPPDLKNEIKRRLQNKLHRCAGPEDLRTSAEILGRITAPGADYSSAFVQEFQVFHRELQEFFNATALEGRLRALVKSGDGEEAEAVTTFLASKAEKAPSDEQLLGLLYKLTILRRLFAGQMERASPHRRSQLRLADIGLEEYAFALLSDCINRLGDKVLHGEWPALLRLLLITLENLRLSLIDPEECSALYSESSTWARAFSPQDRFHLMRVLATLGRARRLAENYTDRINQLFPPRVEELGRALSVMAHAVKVFSEGDIRGHIVFQLSRLVDVGLQSARQALELPPWEAIVPGEAFGLLLHPADLTQVEREAGPILVLLEKADGDAEIPAGVKGIALGHPMPHLSHLGVRARQARIPFASCASPEHLEELERFVGQRVRLRVNPDGLVMQEAPNDADPTAIAAVAPPVTVPDVLLAERSAVLPLDQARPETCGAKATGVQRLLELAKRSGGLFRAPRGLALPFGVMERCLDSVPAIRSEYDALQESLSRTESGQLDSVLQRLRERLLALPIPEGIAEAITDFFGSARRLAVRSSANGEDLENLAGAGLYESVVNVSPPDAPQAITQVWASLWTRRAAISRMQAGIPHARLHMAVLFQELVLPDLCFIMHTVNPLTGNRDEALVELAVGLGEVLASSALPGTPYRLACNRKTGAARLLACGNFSLALRPSLARNATGLIQERLDYGKVALSADPEAAQQLGKRLGLIAAFLEDAIGTPQDVEGACVGEEIYLVQTRPQQGL
jgi:phosphoglucan, water dikinase